MLPGDGLDADTDQIAPLLPRTLERMRPILAAVRNFDHDTFDHYNALQYTTFLYLLANEQWRTRPRGALADRLFCLNRALNAIDLYYAVTMPEVFFVSHGLGTVLGKATYGERLVVFQNVTVGRVGEDRPVLGAGVVLYPGAAVTGSAVIGDNCVISAGTTVHGVEVPPNTVVKSGPNGLVMTTRTRDFLALYFRDSAA
jgi:serine O-acetyltransferase